MNKFKWEDDEAMKRVEAARSRLIDMGFHCLATSGLDLGTYQALQVWTLPKGVIYFVYSTTGYWDIWNSIDSDNSKLGTVFEKLKEMIG